LQNGNEGSTLMSWGGGKAPNGKTLGAEETEVAKIEVSSKKKRRKKGTKEGARCLREPGGKRPK